MQEFEALWHDLDALPSLRELISSQSVDQRDLSHPTNSSSVMSRFAARMVAALSSLVASVKPDDRKTPKVDDRARSSQEQSASKTH